MPFGCFAIFVVDPLKSIFSGASGKKCILNFVACTLKFNSPSPAQTEHFSCKAEILQNFFVCAEYMMSTVTRAMKRSRLRAHSEIVSLSSSKPSHLLGF